MYFKDYWQNFIEDTLPNFSFLCSGLLKKYGTIQAKQLIVTFYHFSWSVSCVPPPLTIVNVFAFLYSSTIADCGENIIRDSEEEEIKKNNTPSKYGSSCFLGVWWSLPGSKQNPRRSSPSLVALVVMDKLEMDSEQF